MCYVAQSTDLLFLKDTDGDGKADLKRRVLNGFEQRTPTIIFTHFAGGLTVGCI